MTRAALDHIVWQEIAPEILPREFLRPDYMAVEALQAFSRIRRRAGVPFRIRSSYRSPARNEAAGGAKGSAHMQIPCTAIDLFVHNNFERYAILSAAVVEGCKRIGVYPAKPDNSGSIHLDFSPTHPAPRIWTRY